MTQYKKNSLSLTGAVSLGTGVMMGAGIFALLGQVAELSGKLFPLIFIAGTVVAGFSSYSYVKYSNTFPSAGGIAMYLEKAYGKSTFTAFAALLMAFSMVIAESLVARTFGTYVLQPFNVEAGSIWVPILGVFLIIGAFVVNISGNNFIEKSALTTAILKVGGIAVFAIGALWASNMNFDKIAPESVAAGNSAVEIIGSIAIAVLTYKGFTTITNSGDEIKNPHKNVSRAIIISLAICTLIYLLVTLAVSSNLTTEEIIAARDYSLAEAARPVFGQYGVWFTVAIAIIATISGIIASIFALSRMTAMLTEMKLIPHSHFGMPGDIQKHMLVYITVIAITLTVALDLSRIASLGAIFYLIMDAGIHWGLLTRLRKKTNPNIYIVITAIILDVVVLGAFIYVKIKSDLLIVAVAVALMLIIWFGEKVFLKSVKNRKENSV